MRNRRYFFIRTFATVKRKSLNRQNKNLSNIYIMNLKSRKTVFITGLCLASLVSGVPLPANASADTTAMIQQQSVKIKGRVTDASGEPVIGANVVQKGTTNGTITDLNGDFTLTVSQGAVLQVSFIGYKQQEVSLRTTVTWACPFFKDTSCWTRLS